MTIQEKLSVLEEIFELEDGDLAEEMRLEDIDEWDSMSKLYLVAHVKKNMQKKLSIEEIENFVTVKDICDYLE